jgi:hypothetical protein
MIKILTPVYTVKIIGGDASLRPLLDAVASQIQKDREVKLSYFFANGSKREFDAAIVCDDTTAPHSDKPYRKVKLKNAPSCAAVCDLTAAIKSCMDNS